MSTEYVTGWRIFYDIVTDLPGLYKEKYIKYGVQQFRISERTAKKRLNDEIKENGSMLFEIKDSIDVRKKRVFPLGAAEADSLVPITIPAALGTRAKFLLERGLRMEKWEERYNAFHKALELTDLAIQRLDRAAAERRGRIKYNTDRNKLQAIQTRIYNVIRHDPDSDKMLALVTREKYPSNSFPFKSFLRPPENPYRNAVCLIQTKHFIMHKLPAAHRKAQKSPVSKNPNN